MVIDIEWTRVADSQLAREITELVRDTESQLLFHHSSRVFYWGALTGTRRGLTFDAELLYAGAMFHDMGLTHRHSSADERFEVDGANAARDFLRGHGISQRDINRECPENGGLCRLGGPVVLVGVWLKEMSQP